MGGSGAALLSLLLRLERLKFLGVGEFRLVGASLPSSNGLDVLSELIGQTLLTPPIEPPHITDDVGGALCPHEDLLYGREYGTFVLPCQPVLDRDTSAPYPLGTQVLL